MQSNVSSSQAYHLDYPKNAESCCISSRGTNTANAECMASTFTNAKKKKACTHTWNNKSVIRNRPASSSSCGLIPQLLHSSHRHPNHILRCCHYRRNGHLPASPAWRTVKVVKVQCTRINSDRSSSTHKYSPRHVPHRQSFRLHIRT